MGGTAVVFLFGGAEFITEFSHHTTDHIFLVSLSAFAAVLTCAVFAIGDLGVINVIRVCLRTDHSSVYGVMRERILRHAALIGAHAFLLPIVAWFSTNAPSLFLWALNALAILNVIWLGLSLQDFDDVRTKIERDSTFWLRLRECQRAMRVWLTLNGVFILVNSALPQVVGSSTNVLAIGLLLACIRTFIDMHFCHRYYRAVLLGDFADRNLL